MFYNTYRQFAHYKLSDMYCSVLQGLIEQLEWTVGSGFLDVNILKNNDLEIF